MTHVWSQIKLKEMWMEIKAEVKDKVEVQSKVELSQTYGKVKLNLTLKSKPS